MYSLKYCELFSILTYTKLTLYEVKLNNIYTFLEDIPNWGKIRIKIEEYKTGSKANNTNESLNIIY